MSRGIDNKDSGAFKSSNELVGRVHRNARDLERTIENLSVGNLMDDVAGGAVGSGFRGSATLQVANAHGGSAEKREEERRKFTRAMYRAMRDLEELYDLRDQLNGEIEQHQRNIDTAQDIINDIRDGKEIEVNEDGTLKNEEYERLRREYEKRTGKKLDPNDTDMILQAMLEQQAHERKQLDRKVKKRDEVEQKIDEASPEIRDAVEAGRPKEVEAIVEDMDTQTLEGAVVDLEKQEHKNIVRAAAGGNEREVGVLMETDQSGQTANGFTFANMLNDSSQPPFDPARSTSAAKAIDGQPIDQTELSEDFNTAAVGTDPAIEPPAPAVATAPDFNPFKTG